MTDWLSFNAKNLFADGLGALAAGFVLLSDQNTMTKVSLAAVYVASHFIYDNIAYLLPASTSRWMTFALEIGVVGIIFYFFTRWWYGGAAPVLQIVKYVFFAVAAGDLISPIVGGQRSVYMAAVTMQ